MSDVLVVGGGFAGVWSAVGAARLLRMARSERSVTLIAPNDDLVIRPRLYEAHPERMSVPLDRVLGPVGVKRVVGAVSEVDTARRLVTATGRGGQAMELSYRKLVIASGSRLSRPELPGAEHLHDIDTLDAAVALDRHIHALPGLPDASGRFTAVVVGAGFTGLEIATELVDRLRVIATPAGAAEEVRVVLVDRADVVGPELGPGPRPVIDQALTALGVEVRLGVTARRLDGQGVLLSDGTEIPARTVVWTAGMEAGPLTARMPAPRDRLGRLHVDPYLRVAGLPDVYAAGDTAAAAAEDGHHVMQSCQHAGQLGKYAGHNVAADLLGLPLDAFQADPYVTCLALGSAGAVLTTGWDRTVRATGESAASQKRAINEKWIYPPVDDVDEILRRADHRTSARRRVDAPAP